MSLAYKRSVQQQMMEMAAEKAELVDSLRETSTLLQSALLCTTPTIASEAMAYVRRAQKLIAKADGKKP